MTTSDFRADQLQVGKIIATGSTGTGARVLIYPIDAEDSSTPNIGIIDPSKFNTGSIGTDIFLFVSGGIGNKDVGDSHGVTVFGGDVHVSGNLTFLSASLTASLVPIPVKLTGSVVTSDVTSFNFIGNVDVTGSAGVIDVNILGGDLELIDNVVHTSSFFAAQVGKIHLWGGGLGDFTQANLPSGSSGDRIGFLAASGSATSIVYTPSLTISASYGQRLESPYDKAGGLVNNSIILYNVTASYVELIYADRNNNPAWILYKSDATNALTMIAEGNPASDKRSERVFGVSTAEYELLTFDHFQDFKLPGATETGNFSASLGRIHVFEGALITTASLPVGQNGDRIAFMSNTDGSFLGESNVILVVTGSQIIHHPGGVGMPLSSNNYEIKLKSKYYGISYLELIYADRSGDPAWIVRRTSARNELELWADGFGQALYGSSSHLLFGTDADGATTIITQSAFLQTITGSNLTPSGSQIFASASGNTLYFRTLVVTGSELSLSQSATGIILSSSLATGSNVGGGSEVFKEISGPESLVFRTLTAIGGISLSQSANTIVISASNEYGITSGSNLGSGSQVYTSASADTLYFLSIVGTGSISVSQSVDSIIISASNASSDFLPISGTTHTTDFTASLGFTHLVNDDYAVTTLLPSGSHGDRVAFLTMGTFASGPYYLIVSSSNGKFRGAGLGNPPANALFMPFTFGGGHIELLYVSGATPSTGLWNIVRTSTLKEMEFMASGSGNILFGKNPLGTPYPLGPVGEDSVVARIGSVNIDGMPVPLNSVVARGTGSLTSITMSNGTVLGISRDDLGGFGLRALDLASGSNFGGGFEVFSGSEDPQFFKFRTLTATGSLSLSQSGDVLVISSSAIVGTVVTDVTGFNLGAGAQVHASSSFNQLYFRSLVVTGSELSISESATELILSSTLATGSNVGGGFEVFKELSGSAESFIFRTLTAIGGVSISQSADTLVFSASNEYGIITGSNLGTGAQVFASASFDTLFLRSLVVTGSELSISESATEIIISSSLASGSNFGGGFEVFSGSDTPEFFKFRTLLGTGGVSLSQSGDTIVFSASNEFGVTTGSNLGGGFEIFQSASFDTLYFRTLSVTGSELSISQSATGLIISSSLASGSNAGGGFEIFSGSNASELFAFRTLTATGATSISQSGDTLVISSSTTATSGTITTGSNVGGGVEVFRGVTADSLDFRTFTSLGGTTVSQSGDTIVISSSAGSTSVSGSNLGTGSEVFASSSGDTLYFRTLSGSGGTTVSQSANTLIITSTAAQTIIPIQELIDSEVVSGSDVNLTDPLSYTPVTTGSVLLFQNGVFQSQGTARDYLLTGSNNKTVRWLNGTGTAESLDTTDFLDSYYFTNVVPSIEIRQEHITTQDITGSDTNLTSQLAFEPESPSSVLLFLNGLQQIQGTGQDYVISGTQTIRWLAGTGTATALSSSDLLDVYYFPLGSNQVLVQETLTSQNVSGSNEDIIDQLSYNPRGPNSLLLFVNGQLQGRGFDRDYLLTGSNDRIIRWQGAVSASALSSTDTLSVYYLMGVCC